MMLPNYEGKPVDVVQVTQSPLNAQQWMLSLSCGHERWVTEKTRPKMKRTTCTKCPRK